MQWMKSRTLRELGLVAILGLLAVGLLFSKALRTNGSIVPAALLYERDGIYKQLDIATNLEANKTLFDLTFQMYPWATFTWFNLKQFTVPLWNPYSLAGTPFLANPQTSVFELTKLLAYIGHVSVENFMLFSSIITMWLAMLFTYAFARQALRLSRSAAVVSAFGFAWSGPMVVWLGYP